MNIGYKTKRKNCTYILFTITVLWRPGNCQQFVFLYAKLFAVELLKQLSTIDLLCMWTYDINKSKPNIETKIKLCKKNITTEKSWKRINRCCVCVWSPCMMCKFSTIRYLYHRVSQYQHHCDLSPYTLPQYLWILFFIHSDKEGKHSALVITFRLISSRPICCKL